MKPMLLYSDIVLMSTFNSNFSMSDKIDQLCNLLNDIEDPTDSLQPGIPPQTSDKKQKVGLKISLFQMGQRIDFLENKLSNLQENGFYDEAKMDISAEAASKPAVSTDLPNEAEKIKPRQETGIKGILSRHEFAINEVNMRLVELKNAIRGIGPNEIRTHIQNIAEIIMKEEKKEVVAEMTDIKGTQQKSGQIVTLLKEELKSIDERLKKDIDKKIERKDLNSTKNQLRKQVI